MRRFSWWPLAALLSLPACRDLEALVLGASGGQGGSDGLSGSSGYTSGAPPGAAGRSASSGAGVGGAGVGSAGPAGAGGMGSGGGGAAGSAPTMILDPCPAAFPVLVGPLAWREGLPDRVWASCAGETGALYEPRPDGTMLLRLTIKVTVGPSQWSELGEAYSVDLDADGASDLLVGYARGGPGGLEGGLLWSRALEGGKFAPLQRIIALASKHFAVANLDDQPGFEIVGVDGSAAGQGRLLVYRQQGTRWQLASSTPIAGAPRGVSLKDIDGDGSLDAVVQHEVGWTEMKVYPGRGLSFRAADPNQHPPIPSRHDPRKADLDGDGVRDDEIFLTDLPTTDGKLPISPRGLGLRRRRPLKGVVVEEAQPLSYPAAGR